MRKFIHVKAILILLLSAAVISCKKSFLDITPKGLLIPSTFEDYDNLMNYSGYYYYQAGIWQPAMLMGDEISAEGTAYNGSSMQQGQLFFQWETNIFLPSTQMGSSSDKPAFLSSALSDLYSLNLIIDHVNNASNGTTAQKMDVQSQAKATRAFVNFQLVNYFTKPYNATTAATDPGFPVITVPDATNTDFKRGTVQQSYDAIINDLTTAIPNLSIQPPVATRMSKAGAEALLGKVYLFMGKNDEALKMFNDAFTDIGRMSKAPKLYDYNQTLAAGGAFLPINPQSGPSEPFNSITDLTESVVARMSYAGGFNGSGYPNDFMTINPQTVALYKPSDLRLLYYSNLQKNQNPIPVAAGQQKRLRKYGVSYSRIGMQLGELYLLRAESRARANDLTGAKTDVETLRASRMPAADVTIPANIANDRTALVKFIIEERIREFAGEGYRWFDMRRLSTDPLFTGQPAPKHILYDVNGNVSKTFTLAPERLTLKLPGTYLLAHPDMVDNP